MKKLLLVFLLFPFISIAQTNDLAVDSVFHRMGVGGYFPDGLDYYKIPNDQISPVNFSALVRNNGSNDLTNCFLTVQVWRDGIIAFEETSDSVDILAGHYDSLFITTPYTPSYNGLYDIVYWIKSDSVDIDNSNDTLYSFFEITDYEYSRSNGMIRDTLYPADSSFAVGSAGNLMIATNDMCIGALNTHVPPNDFTSFELVYGIVYKYDGTTFYYETQTDDFDINDGGDITLYFDSNPAQIYSGELFLVMTGYYSDSIGFQTAQKSIQGSTKFVGPSGAIEFNPLNVIDLSTISIFSFCDIGLNENPTSIFALNQNTPNPFNENTTISYSLKQPGNVELVITDQVGKIVYSESHGQQLGGDNSIALYSQNWESGIYFYTLIVNGIKKTKRMVII